MGFSLCALKNVVRDAMPDVEMILKESPVGDHAADGGSGERGQGGQETSRMLNSSWQEKATKHVSANQPNLTWLPRHGANCLTRSRIGEDCKTAEQRRTGRHWLEPALEIGERIHWMPAPAQEPRSGLQPRIVERRYVGHHSRTGSIFAMRNFNRMSLEERCGFVEFENLRGTP